jgi:hypothetical protein
MPEAKTAVMERPGTLHRIEHILVRVDLQGEIVKMGRMVILLTLDA